MDGGREGGSKSDILIWSEGWSGGLESRQAVNWASRECRCQSDGAVVREDRGRGEETF